MDKYAKFDQPVAAGVQRLFSLLQRLFSSVPRYRTARRIYVGLLLLLAPALLHATTGTGTTLTASSSTVAGGAAVTLTATVQAGSTAVTAGNVAFYDSYSPALPIRQLQLSGSGKAVLQVVLGVGSHSLTAVYSGTSTYLGSTSSAQAVRVTPNGKYLTMIIAGASGGQGYYRPYATVLAEGNTVPTGNVTIHQGSAADDEPLGSGTLAYAQGSLNALPGSTIQAVTGDLNGDGNLDLVTANGTGGVSVLLGHGDGTFGAPNTFQPEAIAKPFAKVVALADVNGDGLLDLVAIDGSTDMVVLPGKGDGTFGTATVYSLATLLPMLNVDSELDTFTLADVNGDGKPDILIGTDGDSSGNILLMANKGDGTFAAPVVVTSDSSVDGLAVADVTGDGIPDIVYTNQVSATMNVLPGKGDGTFGKASSYGTDSHPSALQLADLNGDGKPDALVTTLGGQTDVLLGAGGGAFGSFTSYTTTGGTNSIAGDFDHDGKLDFATILPAKTVNTGSLLEIFHGNGDGSFATPTMYPTNFYPYFIVAGDFNGDSQLDIAAAVPQSASNSTGALLLTAATSYTAQYYSGVGVSSTTAVYATYNQGQNDAYAGSTSGAITLSPAVLTLRFSTPPPANAVAGQAPSTVVVETDADGTPKTNLSATVTLYVSGPNGYAANYTVTSSNGYATFRNLPTLTLVGTYTYQAVWSESSSAPSANETVVPGSNASATKLVITPAFPALSNPGTSHIFGIAAEDAYGNVVTAFTGAVTLTSTDAAAVFTPATHYYAAADAGKFTFQVALNTAGTQTITATAPGLPAVSQTVSVITSPVSVALVFAPSANVNALAPSILTATVTNAGKPVYPGTITFYDNSSLPNAIGTAQLNQQGVASLTKVLPVGTHPILAVLSPTKNTPLSSSSTATLTVTPQQNYTTTVRFYQAIQFPGYLSFDSVLGVFGKPLPTGTLQYIDLTTNNVLGSVTPNTSFSYLATVDTIDTRTGTPAYALAAGDLDGDGLPDLVAVNSATTDNTVTTYLNSSGSLRSGQVYAVGHTPTGIALADVNNDGKLDIVVTNTGDNTVSVLLGNGDGTFQAAVSYPTGAAPKGIVIADFDGDGNLDIVTANSGSNTLSLLVGKGDGTFQAGKTLTVGNGATALATADFNGDGVPDIAVGNATDKTITILLGAGNGTFQTKATYKQGPSPVSMVAADFGNGQVDLAVASGSVVDEYIGAGDGTFTLGPGVTAGNGAVALAVADFNLDGYLDVAVAYSQAVSKGAAVLYGNSTGSFSTVNAFDAVGAAVQGVAAADFTGQGTQEMAISQTTVPSEYNSYTKEQAISLLPFIGAIDAPLTNVNIYDSQYHAVTAEYVPGPGDAYAGSNGTTYSIAGAYLDVVFFYTYPPSQLNAGQAFPVLAAYVAADGITDTKFNGPITIGIKGVDVNYQQTYTANAVNGIATFSNLPSLTQAGSYEYGVALTPALPNYYSSQSFKVIPGDPTQIAISNPLVSPAVSGVVDTIGVTIVDAYANPVSAFTGTVSLSSSDTAAVFTPQSHTFVPADNGYASFATVFHTVGVQSVTATTAGLTMNTATQTNVRVLTPNVATSTTLTLSPAAMEPAGTPVTLTATVKDAALNPVVLGTADFYDTSATPQILLRSVPLSSNGTASISVTLPVGTHAVSVAYEPKNAYQTSTSPVQNLIVAPAANYPVQSTLTATGSKGNYGLADSSNFFGRVAPAGKTVNFVDTSNGNALLGTGTLSAPSFVFGPQVAYPTTGDGANSVAVGDYNGDGKPDLLVTNGYDGVVSLLLGKGDTTFGAATTVFTVSGLGTTEQVVSGDFNGDGKLDYAVLTFDGEVYLALGNGDGTFAAPVEVVTAIDKGAYSYADNPYVLSVGDFNRDGKLDLAITDALDSTVVVLIGYGDGTFQKQIAYAGETSPQGIALADVNNDGKIDLVVTNSAGNTVSVLLGNGDGTFQQQTTYPTGKTPEPVTTADLNGDGYADLVVINAADNTISVFVNNGNGTFKSQVVYSTGGGPFGLVAVDLNGDNIPDIAVTNSYDDTVSIYYGNGNGTFPAAVVVPTGYDPTGVAAGDFGGNGLISLAIANADDDTVSILPSVQVRTASLSNVVLSGNGAHNVVATYTSGTNDAYASANSNVVELLGSGAGPAATTTTVASDYNPGYAGYPVDFTATVASPVGVLAAGTVTFYDGTTSLGSVTLAANRTAILSNVLLSQGNHNITAVYSGDVNYATSTTPVLVQSILSNGLYTQLNLSALPNPAATGAAVTLRGLVVVVDPALAPPTGTITFFDGPTVLGTGTINRSGVATFVTTSLAAGKHDLTAAYSGDNTYGGSGSNDVTEVITSNGAATTTTVSASASSLTFGQSVIFTAQVSSTTAGTPSGTVSFYDGGTLLGTGTLSGGKASFTTSSLGQGTHTITVSYAGDGTFSGSTSTGIAVTVTAVPVAVTSTTLVSSANPSLAGQSVTFTATVTITSTSKPTAAVSFYDGATLLGSSALSPATATTYTATFTTVSLAGGSHSITASYSGDSNNAASTSMPVTQLVNKAMTLVMLAPAPNPSVFGTTVTLTATISTTGTVAPSGDVTFLDGTATLGTGTIASGTASMTVNTLSAGTHNLSASFGGDASNTSGSSPTVVQVVTKASTTTVVASSVNPSAPAQPVVFTATVTPGSGAGPSGTVTFYDGAAPLGSTALTGGRSVFTASTLVTGPHSITVVYSGDTNFTASTSPALTQTVTTVVADFSLSGTGLAQGVQPGAQASFTITATPLNGAYTNPVAFSVSGLPSGFTASFAPPVVTPGASPAVTTLTVQVPVYFAGVEPTARWWMAGGLLLLPLFRRRLSRRLRSALVLLALGATLLGANGCAGGFYGHAPVSYQLTVTGTSGVTQHTTTLTLPVE